MTKGNFHLTQVAPTIYRYMDWLITVPLQVSEFYIILQAASHESRPIPIALFFRLMFAAVFMLVFGYMGETGVMEKMVAFIGGFLMWIWILFEIWFGEAAKSSGMISLEAAKVFLNRVVIRESMRKSNAKVQHNSDSDSDGSQSDKSDSSFSSVTDAENLDVVETNEERLEKMNAKDEAERISGAFKKPEAQMAFELLRYIVTFGWALYPVGYIVGLIDEDLTQDLLNLVYNVADVINKVLYGLAIFYAASADSETDKEIVALSRRPTPDMLLGRKDSMLDLVSKALHQKIAHYDMERVQNSKNRKEGNGSFGNTQSSGPGSSTNESSGISGSQTSDSGMADSVDESSTNNEHDNNTGGDSQSETSNSQPKEKNNEPTTMRLDEAKAETTRTQDHMNDLEDQIRALTAAMDKYPMSSTDHHGVVAANEKPLSRPVTPLHHEKPQFGRD